VVEDGRSYVRRSKEKFEVLQATLVDTWASTAAGAFALSENNLYTSNAFIDYLKHLTPNGIMAFTRWGFKPPRESLRIVALARAALTQLGEPDAADHVLVFREDLQKLNGWGAQDTIIVSRSRLSQSDIEKAKQAAAHARIELVYYPGTNEANAFRDLLLSKDLNAFFDSYPFDVRPVSDDHPFFFYTVQPRDIWHFLTSASKESADYKINKAVPLLFGLLLISLLATLLILILPPILLGRNVIPRDDGAVRSLLYFLCIGAGYILIQVALIQKFVLFLGHPTYALTVIIFSMLISSGLGSFFSNRIVQASMLRLTAVLICIAGAVTLLSGIVIAPMGFLMGMPFPSGLRRLKAVLPETIRWAWSINAAASVLGSAGAMVLAIYCGLSNTLLAGALCYLLALTAALLSPLGKKYLSLFAHA
jgi:hypothetical protein